MSTTRRVLHADAEQIWRVLADGWLYPLWVVGASRMREVDDDWPRVGARLHHSVGSWPLLLDDFTEVLESEPGALLRLRARAWPAGEAEVLLRLEPVGDRADSAGTPESGGETGPETTVVMVEDAVAGPGRLIPQPLRDPQLHWRNTESLRRLAYLAERRR